MSGKLKRALGELFVAGARKIGTLAGRTAVAKATADMLGEGVNKHMVKFIHTVASTAQTMKLTAKELHLNLCVAYDTLRKTSIAFVLLSARGEPILDKDGKVVDYEHPAPEGKIRRTLTSKGRGVVNTYLPVLSLVAWTIDTLSDGMEIVLDTFSPDSTGTFAARRVVLEERFHEYALAKRTSVAYYENELGAIYSAEHVMKMTTDEQQDLGIIWPDDQDHTVPLTGRFGTVWGRLSEQTKIAARLSTDTAAFEGELESQLYKPFHTVAPDHSVTKFADDPTVA